MQTNKTYEFAGYTFKTYFKKAGHGYEVGLTSGSNTYFLGNFVNEKEARKWWGYFNKQVSSFYKKFSYNEEYPREFYGKFMGTFLYKEYYTFLADLFDGYDKYYDKQFDKSFQRYEKMMKTA
jgi:hypothetical protein